MAYASDQMLQLFRDWEAAIPSAVFSGIVGDRAHTYGYHRAANEVPGSDYSRQLVGDRNQDGIDQNAADAIDMSHGPSDQRMVTRRLYDSWKDPNDPRLNYWREIIGTLDGQNVIYMDTQSGHQGTADSSHLWHIHAGGLRVNVNNQHAMAALLSIVKGESWADYFARTDDPIGHGATPVVNPTPTPAPPAPVGRPELRRGSTGVWVSRAQALVWANGFYPTGGVDGDYGAGTDAAVRAFQHAQGIGVDGVVGPVTWGRLVGSQPETRRGAKGLAVKKVQALVIAAGVHPTGGVDGDFGGGTDAAVRAFQHAQGIGVDGDVGPVTWGRLIPAQ